ncbi:energy-coupling factor transporter transmembrane component T family protein [Calothrix sp. 336/3]
MVMRLHLSLIIVVGTALLKQNAWYGLAIYAAIASSWVLFWIIFSQISVRRLLGIVSAEVIFLALMTLPLGRERAIFLVLRSLTCLLTMNCFLLTLSPHSFGIALKSLPLPRAFQETLLLAGQYLEILLSEVTGMQRSAELRGLQGRANWLRYTSTAMIGTLYLRSLARAERVYAAMVVRGYDGNLPVDSPFTGKQKIILGICWAIALCLTVSSYFLE